MGEQQVCQCPCPPREPGMPLSSKAVSPSRLSEDPTANSSHSAQLCLCAVSWLGDSSGHH